MNPSPERHDPAVYKLAFENFWPQLERYCNQSSQKATDDDKASAWKVLEDNSEMDGFQLAKDFEDRGGWVGDSELVDVLEGWHSAMYNAHDTLRKQWRTENNIQPKLKVGDTVTFDKNNGQRWTKPEMITDGVITKVDDHTDDYTVSSPTLGHKMPGSKLCGILGIFVRFHELEKHNQHLIPQQAV